MTGSGWEPDGLLFGAGAGKRPCATVHVRTSGSTLEAERVDVAVDFYLERLRGSLDEIVAFQERCYPDDLINVGRMA